MNKLTKGAIASAAGIILLMGGAGTLASWNSSATAGASQAITAGQLQFGTPTTGTWKDASGKAVSLVVPGDVLTYTQTVALNATGDNLKFTLGITPGTITAASSAGQDVALAALLNTTGNNLASFTIASNPNISLVSGNTYKVASNSGSTTLNVTLTITFPYGTSVDNTTQLGKVNLTAGAITVTQTP